MQMPGTERFTTEAHEGMTYEVNLADEWDAEWG